MLHLNQRFFQEFVFFCCGILFCVSQSLSAASSGTIKGTIFDKDTKDALPGATVIVKGTSIGAASDLNGGFIIHGVPTGLQTLLVSYVGYNSVALDVNVSEGEELQKDIYMEPTAITGKTVVVTAQAQGQMQAINQQLSSNTIENVVSAAKIQELPDFNAAEAIGRLPGISTLRSSGEADQVVIRGIAPQYNLVSIDDITLASTQKYNRAIDLNMISPYMLESIDVYKAITPDMEANAIGGIVNMQLREAPSGLHSDVFWQSGYTAKTSKYNNYKAMGAISDRFFSDKLGVYLLLNSEQYDRSADNMSANYGSQSIGPQVNSMTLDRHFETRSRYGGNLIFDYKLPAGSIQSINMLSRLNSKYSDYNTAFDYVNKYLNFNFGNGNANTDVAIDALQGKYDFGIISMDLSAANTYSRNFNPHMDNYQFSQGLGIKSVVVQPNVPPQDLVSLTQYDSTQSYLNQIGYNSSDFKENDQVYSGNFKVPFNLSSSVSGFFKFGGKYRYNYRTNLEAAPYINLRYLGSHIIDSLRTNFPQLPFDPNHSGFWSYGFTDYNSSLTNDFLSNEFGNLVWAPRTPTLDAMMNYVLATPDLASNSEWHNGAYEDSINDYKNVERYYAGYGMASLDLGPDLTIVGGARYEMDAMLFTGYWVKQQQQSYYAVALPQTVYPKNHFWLPMVQAKYDVTEWSDLRYAYTQTIARPDYTELAPYANTDLYGNYVNAGNPNLQPAEAYNHDLMFTIHSSDVGLLSVGGFYKTISNFSYFAQYALLPSTDTIAAPYESYEKYASIGAHSQSTINTYFNNPYKAYLKGIETDFQTRLWYLPAPFDGIVLSVNYTHIWSTTLYPVPVLVSTIIGRGKFSYSVKDSSRGGRLIDQPDDIANASFGYDYKGFSGRISFLYQGEMISGIGAGIVAAGKLVPPDGITQGYFRMDASARQKLPIEGLEIYLDVNNINQRADISEIASMGGFTSEQFYGLTADVGVRYNF
jgi:TonB-dependent receptor